MRILPKLGKRPEVSVIMAVKNGEATLEAALDSLFYQTVTDWELVVVDDGSTDQTSNILSKYAFPDPNRVRIISQTNQGLTKSLNRALSEIQGRFVARLDADDLNLPHRLETQLKIIRQGEVDFLVSRAVKERKIVPGNFVYLCSSKEYLQYDNTFVHGSFFGKREVFERLKYDESFRFAQDYDFIIRVLKANYRLGYIYEPLYILGTGPNQISSAKREEQRDLSKKIALTHFSSPFLIFYWNLPAGSFLRKVSKLIFGGRGIFSGSIKKILT